jgi:hypothetical protein
MYAEIIHPQLPPMRRVGRNGQYHGPCPFCADGGADRFQVWLEASGGRPAGRYWCRVCQRHGLLSSLNRMAPAHSHPQRTGKKSPPRPGPNPDHIAHYRELYAATALWAHAWLLDGCHPEPLAYLHTRGLDDQIITRSLLGVTLRDPVALVEHLRTTCPEAFPYAEAAGLLVRDDQEHLRTHWNLCDALVFPCLVDGAVVDLRTRRLGAGHKAKSLAGSLQERGATALFGLDDLAGAETVILTESSEFKRLAPQAAYEAGDLVFPTLGHPGLTNFQPTWGADLVARGIQTVILAYDSQPRPMRDGAPALAPEEIATIRHGHLLLEAGLTVRVLRLSIAPGEAKADLDDFLLRYGPRRVQTLLDDAPLLADYHQSLPRPLLEQAKLPLPGSYPTRRARPRRIEMASRVTRTNAPTTALADARQQIVKRVRDHAASGQGVLVLAHPPGVGKGHNTTQGLLAYLREHPEPGQIVWTALRREQQQDQQGLALIPLSGRNPSNCRKFAEVQTLSRKGYPVRQTLCERRCPYVNQCHYLRQFGQVGDFFAPLPLLQATQWWADAGVVVLDEFDPARLTNMVQLSMSDLAAMSRATPCLHAQAVLRWLAQIVATTLDRVLTGALLYGALDDAASTEEREFWATVRQASAALPPPETQVCLPGLPNGATIHDYAALPPNYLATILNVMEREGRKRLAGTPYTSRIEAREGMLTLALRHEHLIAQLARPDQPKIILDAGANVALLRAIFPTTPLEVEQPQIAGAARVIQVISRDWAKSTLHGTRREQWYDTVAAHLRLNRPTLVVCTLDCKADLRQALDERGHADVKIAHYGALRGSNAYRGHDVLLAQVYHPNRDQIIREGRALFADDPIPLNEHMVLEERTLRDSTGTSWTITVPTFVDPRLAALLEARREHELLQAALRGRPLDHPEVQITLLFSLPLAGLPPTIISELPPTPQSNEGRQAATIAALLAAAQQLFAQGKRVISVRDLRQRAGVSANTVRTHWCILISRLHLRSFTQRRVVTLPGGHKRSYARQVLAQRGRRVPPQAMQSPLPTNQARNHGSISRLTHRLRPRRRRIGYRRPCHRRRIWRPPK